MFKIKERRDVSYKKYLPGRRVSVWGRDEVGPHLSMSTIINGKSDPSIYVSFTHSGYNSSSMRLPFSELKEIVLGMQEFIEKLEEAQDE